MARPKIYLSISLPGKELSTDAKFFAICLLCAIPLIFHVFKNYIITSRGWHGYDIQYSTISWTIRIFLIPCVLTVAIRLRSLLMHTGGALFFAAIHIGLSMIFCLLTSSPDKRLWNLYNTIKNESLMIDLTVYALIILIYHVWVRSDTPSQEPISQKSNSLSIKSGQRTIIVKVTEILSIGSEGHYVKVVSERNTNLMTISMKEIQKMLPGEFVRIHRSTIVNTTHVVQTRSLMNGDYLAIMKNGDQHKISRTYRDNLRAVLGNF